MRFGLRFKRLLPAFALIAGAPLSGQMPGMSMPADPLGVSMDRLGSGTSWVPEAVALPYTAFDAGSWNLMLHGSAFGQYDAQGGPRGASQFGSVNWGMLMAMHELAGGRFQARTMLSLDAATVTPRGYPLLLETGESYQGQPVHDRQHPHNFFMELAAMYERPVTSSVGVVLYAAPSGEPALGPPGFPHRPSAMDDPFAPIGHHWQDASHVSFGVATAGVFTNRWKLEGSVFNGRDPDDNRWDLDFHPLDSYSGRATFNPNAQWSLSASYGFLKVPESTDSGHTMHRMVVAVQNGRRLGPDSRWASTLIWGANAHSDDPALSHSALLESELVADSRNSFVGRAEYVQKSASDLVVDVPPFGFSSNQRFGVSEVSLGYVREIARTRGATLGLGAMGTLNVVPSSLALAYGSRTPVGGTVFLRLRPAGSVTNLNDMGRMKMEHNHE